MRAGFTLKLATALLVVAAVFVGVFAAITISRANGGNAGDAAETDVITVISPKQDETVDMDGEKVSEYYKNYTAGSSVNYFGNGEILPMKKVTFAWEHEGNGYYQLFLSRDASFADAEVYFTVAKSVEAENLIPGDYYWRVKITDENGDFSYSDTYKFTAKASIRSVTIDGVSNARDLGGIKTVDGKVTRYGVLYRSANLDGITSAGLKQARRLGLKTDLDLRGIDAPETTPLGSGASIVPIQGAYYLGDPYGINGSTEYKNNFRDELKTLANKDNYPLLFHCAIGRDRTGTLASYVLALCGVSREEIVKEYGLSYFSVSGCIDNSSAGWNNTGIMCDFLTSQTGATLAEKAANYAISLGVTAEEIASIRSILLG